MHRTTSSDIHDERSMLHKMSHESARKLPLSLCFSWKPSTNLIRKITWESNIALPDRREAWTRDQRYFLLLCSFFLFGFFFFLSFSTREAYCRHIAIMSLLGYTSGIILRSTTKSWQWSMDRVDYLTQILQSAFNFSLHSRDAPRCHVHITVESPF